jgi:peptidoglycan/LPS O-acetylase OafA/YrhL
VISGFVVTPLILRALERNGGLIKTNAGIFEFYTRRFLRLAPALGVTLSFSALLIFFFGNIQDLEKFARQGIATIFLLGNYGAIEFSGDYFSPTPNPLIHTWSLSVEEQIYVLLPLLLSVCSIFIAIRKAISLIYISLLLCSFFLYFNRSFLGALFPSLSTETLSNLQFYSTFTRAWQFCFGGIIFLFGNHMSQLKIFSKSASTLRNFWFISTAILCVLLFSRDAISQIVGSVSSTLLTGLTILLANSKFIDNAFQSILEWFGDRSYSIYLIHMPIIYLALHSTVTELQSEQRKILIMIFTLPLILFLSNMSYLFIEKRFRIIPIAPARVTMKRLLGLSFIFITLPLVLFMTILNGERSNYWGFLNVETPKASLLTIEKQCPNIRLKPSTCGNFDQKLADKVLLLGDSHAMHLHSAVDVVARSQDIDAYYWWASPNNQEVLSWVKKEKPELVILSRFVHSKQDAEEMLALAINLKPLVRVLIVGQTPSWPDQTLFMNHGSVASSFFYTPPRKMNIEELQNSDYEIGEYLKTSAQTNDLDLIDPWPLFCGKTSCSRWSSATGWLYSDWSHLSDSGASLLVPDLVNYLYLDRP